MWSVEWSAASLAVLVRDLFWLWTQHPGLSILPPVRSGGGAGDHVNTQADGGSTLHHQSGVIVSPWQIIITTRLPNVEPCWTYVHRYHRQVAVSMHSLFFGCAFRTSWLLTPRSSDHDTKSVEIVMDDSKSRVTVPVPSDSMMSQEEMNVFACVRPVSSESADWG